MIVYNITFKIEGSVYEDWLKWMKEEQVPAMLDTRLFVDHRIMRLLDTDETEGPTVAVQYYAASLKDYNQYVSDYYGSNNQREFARWQNRVLQFSTVMEVID